MKTSSTWRVLSLLIGLLCLAACATNETKPVKEVEPVQTAPVPTVAITPQAPPPVDPSVVIPNPSVVTFEKMSISLDDKAKETIARLSNRARAAKRISITGFCDQKQIRNATDSAMARAVAVRDALLSYGIEPANIRMTLNLKAAKKHAAEIKFED